MCKSQIHFQFVNASLALFGILLLAFLLRFFLDIYGYFFSSLDKISIHLNIEIISMIKNMYVNLFLFLFPEREFIEIEDDFMLQGILH